MASKAGSHWPKKETFCQSAARAPAEQVTSLPQKVFPLDPSMRMWLSQTNLPQIHKKDSQPLKTMLRILDTRYRHTAVRQT